MRRTELQRKTPLRRTRKPLRRVVVVHDGKARP